MMTNWNDDGLEPNACRRRFVRHRATQLKLEGVESTTHNSGL